jgi:hypothetical protein
MFDTFWGVHLFPDTSFKVGKCPVKGYTIAGWTMSANC